MLGPLLSLLSDSVLLENRRLIEIFILQRGHGQRRQPRGRYHNSNRTRDTVKKVSASLQSTLWSGSAIYLIPMIHVYSGPTSSPLIRIHQSVLEKQKKESFRHEFKGAANRNCTGCIVYSKQRKKSHKKETPCS